MIRYNLECKDGHTFDGWFGSSDAFEAQAKRKLVTCPECGSHKVTKSIMAPSVVTTKGREPATTVANAPSGSAQASAARSELVAAMRKVREIVEANAEYVGPKFAEEARKIHYGERSEAGIYGEATPDEVSELHDEGIDCLPLPVLPEDKN